MRRFSAEYLERTRAGMWDDSRAALSDLDFPNRRRVLDVGCGTGELTRVLVEETAAGREGRDDHPDDANSAEPRVVGLDADRALLAAAGEHAPVVEGDALRLPFADGAFDLVVCQALLVNLPDPAAAVGEFARVSSELVAAVEPDNEAVEVTSSVAAEERLEARARRAYLDGVATDAALGEKGTREAFEAAGVDGVHTRRYAHRRVVEPPYDEGDLADARRKATGAGLDDDRETLLDSDDVDEEAFGALRSDWRAMGRSVVEQMRDGDYCRTETVPFYVTVGRV